MTIATGEQALASDVIAQKVTVAETEVFASAAGPIAWTDLNLSAVVGVQSAVVLLKIARIAVANAVFAVRKNGDTEEYFTTNPTDGTGIGMACSNTFNGYVVVMCATDSNGVIEWKVEAAGTTWTVDIIAWWPTQ